MPLAALLLVLPAETPEPGGPAAQVEGEREPTGPRADGGRVRVGLDFGVTGALAYGNRCGNQPCTGMGALSFGVDLGYQANRTWGVMFRGEFGSALLSNFAGAHALVELNPIRQLSLGGGIGVEGIANIFVNSTSNYYGVAVPLRIAYNFLSEESWGQLGRNRAWRLALNVVPGWAHEQEFFFVRAGLVVGFSWM